MDVGNWTVVSVLFVFLLKSNRDDRHTLRWPPSHVLGRGDTGCARSRENGASLEELLVQVRPGLGEPGHKDPPARPLEDTVHVLWSGPSLPGSGELCRRFSGVPSRPRWSARLWASPEGPEGPPPPPLRRPASSPAAPWASPEGSAWRGAAARARAALFPAGRGRCPCFPILSCARIFSVLSLLGLPSPRFPLKPGVRLCSYSAHDPPHVLLGPCRLPLLGVR